MIKHVGKHNNRKVVILYKTVPGEDHMCLLSYSDSLPQSFHDEVMRVLESPVGQQAKELSDALFRNLLPDGRNILHSLHQEGLIKKVPTSQVIVTPKANSSVRLDELNTILAKMEEGESAVKKLKELDDQLGVRDPLKSTKTRDLGEPVMPSAEVLSDADLARARLEQAMKMRADAEQLITEATRLEQEAETLSPSTDVNPKKTNKKIKVS
jgi:hypothetical protein